MNRPDRGRKGGSRIFIPSEITIFSILEIYSALTDADVARIWWELNPTGLWSQPLIVNSLSSDNNISGVRGDLDIHIFVADAGLDVGLVIQLGEDGVNVADVWESLDTAEAGLDNID